MLSRYARIDPETGVYTKPENPNVIYGSLTSVWLFFFLMAPARR
jgi:acyl-CoA oxidase